jgi:predicted nucleic acid-binding protein
VVDTCVFLKLTSNYSKILDCVLSNDDIIAISNECLKEYEGRSYASVYLLQSFLQELDGKNKLKRVKKSFVEARINRLENHRRIVYPSHHKDKKWVKLAVSIGAYYILSTNDHLLDLPPNPCNTHHVESIEPFDYISNRCPELV